MKLLLARIRQSWHSLIRFHRAEGGTIDGRTFYLGCADCDREFYDDPPSE